MKVRVKTPSRLHLGIMDLSGESGTLYGSVGVALEKPNTVLEAEKGKEVPPMLRPVAKKYGIKEGISYRIKESIPEHSGLGSGTQLALALGTAYARLYGIDAKPMDLAEILGLGKVSGIGIAAFEGGGFIVDSGVDKKDPRPPVPLFQQPFPEGWFFAIAVPETEGGLHGEREDEAFKEAIPGPRKLAEGIRRIVHEGLLPAFKERDIISFGRNLTSLDEKTGEWFQKAQGGLHRTREVIEAMKDLGALGVGQSSWGPACYALIEEKRVSAFEAELKKKTEGIVFSAKADNRGAVIEEA